MKGTREKAVRFLGLMSVMCFMTAAVYAGAGSNSCEFLRIGIGARALGMGGSFTGLADDVSAGYWNPGGLVQLNNSEVLTMYNSWLGGMSHVYLGFGSKTAGGALGLQVNYLTSGEIPKSDAMGQDIGSFGASWMAVGLSYAFNFGDATGVGITLKNVTETIESASGSGLSADAGVLYRAGENMKLGLAVQNAGEGVKYAGDESAAAFPLVVRAGASYALTNEEEKGLVVTSDISKADSSDGMGIGLGCEYRAGRMSLRAGAEQIGGAVVPSFGLGFNSGSFLVDVGGGMYQELGSTYKVSLIGKF